MLSVNVQKRKNSEKMLKSVQALRQDDLTYEREKRKRIKKVGKKDTRTMDTERRGKNEKRHTLLKVSRRKSQCRYIKGH